MQMSSNRFELTSPAGSKSLISGLSMHLLPKTATLCPETGDFVAVSGNFVVRNGDCVSGDCRRFWQQNRLFPDTKSPFSAASVDRR